MLETFHKLIRLELLYFILNLLQTQEAIVLIIKKKYLFE